MLLIFFCIQFQTNKMRIEIITDPGLGETSLAIFLQGPHQEVYTSTKIPLFSDRAFFKASS